jgi:hypothetical protein
MIAPTIACPHNSVAPYGVDAADPSNPVNPTREEHETGWCRDCSQYVQRQLGASAWALRPGHERGAWMWRNYGAPVGRG